MNKTTRIEWKVGLFVLIGLVLFGALMLNFSKGITRFKSTYKLHLIMTTVNRTILNDSTLTNFGLAVSNFYTLTADAGAMVHQIGGIITTNTEPINAAVKSLHQVSEKLDKMADDLHVIISTNATEIST